MSLFPHEAETAANEELSWLLLSYHYDHPQGATLDATLPGRYIYVPHGRRRVDRVIWAGLRRRPDPKEDVPTVAVEFVSARQRDRRRDFVAKRTEYRTVGIKEYWIINRFRQEMTVCFQDGSQRVIPQDQTYETPLLPGFVLPLGRILAVAAAWADRGENDDDATTP